MSKLLPGNIIYGGDVLTSESSQYHSLGQMLLAKLKHYDQEVALIDAVTDTEYTFNYIYKEVIRLAQVLQQLGIGAGDVVCLSSENRIEFVYVMYAAISLNATIAPINVTYTKREMDHALNLSKPKVVFASDLTIDTLADVANSNSFVKTIVTFDSRKPANFGQAYTYKELCENKKKFPSKPTFEAPPCIDKKNDVALIVCSSGTTGMPKGVQLTQANLMSALDMQYDESILPESACILSVLPWFHAFGNITVVLSTCIGAKLVFLPKFEEKLFLGSIEKYRIILIFMVPPLMVFLAKHPLVDNYDLSSLLGLLCGAAPLSKETVDLVQKRIGVPIIRQGYGLSESTLGVMIQSDAACSPGSVGILKPGLLAKVIDPDTGAVLGPNQRGELCFKGDTIMKGYIGDPESSQSAIQDGWLHTGDVGYYTDSLEFFIVDRIKELIKYKAFQVPPAEIEALLLTHPQISDAAVIGRPDEEAGELPMAFIVKQPGAKLTEQEVIQFVKDRASSAKRLRGGVIFLKEIPKNPSGKILRRVLRDMLKNEAPQLKSKL